MTKELEDRLRALSEPVEEWRVESPDGESMVAWFSARDGVNPKGEADRWLANHKRDHPGSRHAHYVVRQHFVRDERGQAMFEAAEALQAARIQGGFGD